ncbi:hypothetical protein [Campylobacter sp. RM12637]|uniref:hypothetical protein n=1 Tax=Campylobacter sp. RM12637 TaxID=2735734 RepID=UPI003014C31D|nr:hypothetical protein [Campylobacter sp. RM12637]
MKKLLSLTTMAMIALTTPTLNADTTANTTKTVKKNDASKTVDYSKMNYEQLKKIVTKTIEEDTPIAIEADNIHTKIYSTKGSEADYKKIVALHDKIVKKRASLIAELDKRREKYDINHENNREAYLAYVDLYSDVHKNINLTKMYIELYRAHLDKINRLNSY